MIGKQHSKIVSSLLPKGVVSLSCVTGILTILVLQYLLEDEQTKICSTTVAHFAKKNARIYKVLTTIFFKLSSFQPSSSTSMAKETYQEF